MACTTSCSGAAAKPAPIIDLQAEAVDSLIFDSLLQAQSHRLALSRRTTDTTPSSRPRSVSGSSGQRALRT